MRRHRNRRGRWWGWRLIPLEFWVAIAITVIVVGAAVIYEVGTK